MTIKLPAMTDFGSEVCIVPMEVTDNQVFLNSRNTTGPSLDSCVTCSGCITSAEEIFVKDCNADSLKLLIQS